MKQQSLLDGSELRDIGIKQAVEHAEETTPNWQEAAMNFLRGYAETHRSFMAEDVRAAAAGFVPVPPSLRAFGGIMLSAAKKGWIVKIGHRAVRNNRAHMAFASVWESRLR